MVFPHWHKLKAKIVVVVKPAHQVRVMLQHVWKIMLIEKLAKRIRDILIIILRLRGQKLTQFWRIPTDLLISLLFRVQNPQWVVGLQPLDTQRAQPAKIFLLPEPAGQLLRIPRALLEIPKTIHLDLPKLLFKNANRPYRIFNFIESLRVRAPEFPVDLLQNPMAQHDYLYIIQEIITPNILDPYLIKLSPPALLRSFVSEHGAIVINLLGQIEN